MLIKKAVFNKSKPKFAVVKGQAALVKDNQFKITSYKAI